MKRLMAVAAVALLVGLGAWFYSLWSGSADGGASSPGVPASSAMEAPAELPPRSAQTFKDTSMLKPPAGSKVAIYEFDDLECPACAHAVPIVHAAAAQYGIPIVHHDYPLTEIHVWSFDAAVTARYLQDDVSVKLADEFRLDVFAHQNEITSKDDLAKFTQSWFDGHGQKLPFVLDARGTCRNEVAADRALGEKLGVPSTPCIFVVTDHGWAYVDDVSELYRTIDAAMAGTNASEEVARKQERTS